MSTFLMLASCRQHECSGFKASHAADNVDYLVSSANKNIEGVPGFCLRFVTKPVGARWDTCSHRNSRPTRSAEWA